MRPSRIQEVRPVTQRPVPDRDAVDDIVDQWAHQWPDLDVSPLKVLGRLHRSYLRYQSSLAAVFEEHGINMASFDVMAALRRSGPPYRMTSGQLAESALVTTGGVTLRVDRLEKAGLVQRERDAEDRRIVHAQLTDEGLRVIEKVAEAHFANESQILSGMSKDDQAALAELLRKLEHSIVENQAPTA
ncbi:MULTISPECIES: MarR family winged helix-turn-helix transcriptional regulator [Rhodococcus]|uniref:MarR family winged helix-turn-helix transcriptional regulator n=1 Tax=Rhodococcus TaxID=1827 RepID=UPI00157F98EA|nr:MULTISPECIES: MarR family transcriptional regulator [Rhodococcus]MDF3304897.1 MarR family transcriptional regulator [Rhodococcus sp. T2V]QSE81608.1 MarR family transcriptional regulator [Rhodococcus koreensis]QYB01282.1 MarR family transcriptional regulator [Rhodococcus sp. USK10]